MELFRPRLYTSIEEAEKDPGRVRRLHLHGKSWDYDICPKRLAQFVHLAELQIGWYSDRKLPDEIQGLEQLRSLVCLNTPLEDLPDWLFSLGQLYRLTVRGSDVRQIPDQIQRLAGLRDVDFGNNGLTDVPATLGSLPMLERLGLSDNRLTTLPEAVASLSRLRSLVLVGNAFSEREADTIKAWFRPGLVTL